MTANEQLTRERQKSLWLHRAVLERLRTDYIDEWQGYGTRQVFRYLGRRVDLAEATPAF